MNIIYNGKKYGQRHCINNIKREYNSTLSLFKNDWYAVANMFAQSLHVISGIYSIEICCGVIAALSPLKNWSQNKKLAEGFILYGIKKGHTNIFNDKALQILAGANIEQTLKGKKIIAFYNNILNPQSFEHVTIDRHAVNIALNKLVYVGAANYEFFKTCYIKAANELQINVLLLQSATWQNWRNKHQYKKFKI